MSKLLSGFCLAGTDKTPYSIDSLKFSTLQLICLGFWDKSDNTFLEIAPDQESHPVFVVFDEKTDDDFAQLSQASRGNRLLPPVLPLFLINFSISTKSHLSYLT